MSKHRLLSWLPAANAGEKKRSRNDGKNKLDWKKKAYFTAIFRQRLYLYIDSEIDYKQIKLTMSVTDD